MFFLNKLLLNFFDDIKFLRNTLTKLTQKSVTN